MARHKFEIRDRTWRKVFSCMLIMACCSVPLLPVVFDNYGISWAGVESDLSGDSAQGHPALKALDNPVPPIDKNNPNKAVPVSRRINLEEGELYSPMNVSWSAEDMENVNNGVYKLTEQGKNSRGKDTFKAEQVISYIEDKGKSYEPIMFMGAAMGMDMTEGNKPVMYLTQGTNPFTIWKAIDGERKLYKVAEFNSPNFPGDNDDGLQTQCFNSSTAMAPNGTLWFTTARDDPVKEQGKVLISMLDPQLDERGKTRLIDSVKPEDPDNPDTHRESSVVNALDPDDRLKGQCLRGGVFDSEGFYYLRVGQVSTNASDDILRFDLSGFPEKVTFTRIKFAIDRYGVGLTWHNEKWWSAPGLNVLSAEENPKDLSAAAEAFNVHPMTAVKTLVSIPNFSDGYPLVPLNNMVSTEFAPPLSLQVEHSPQSADKTEVTRSGTLEYTVHVSNSGDNGGLWYTGEVFVDLNGILNFVEEGSLRSSMVEVVDYKGVFLDAGKVRLSDGRLIWSGTIPLGGSFTWTYKAKVRSNVKDGQDLDTFVYTSSGWNSNCSPEIALTEAACQARTTVKDSNLYVTKVHDVGDGGTSAISRGIINYTITAVNGGSKPYVGDITDDLSGLLDKAKYNYDAVVTMGRAPIFAPPLLQWTGKINPGETLVIKYSVQLLRSG